MPFTDFTDFCASLCTLIGVEPEPLVPDEDGIVGFTANCDGVDIGFMEAHSGDEPGVVMMADFGNADEATELEVLRELLNTNFLLSGIAAPAFVRNPITGELAFHQSWLLSQVSAQDAYERMANAADVVHRWKAGTLLSPRAMPGSGAGQGIDVSHIR